MIANINKLVKLGVNVIVPYNGHLALTQKSVNEAFALRARLTDIHSHVPQPDILYIDYFNVSEKDMYNHVYFSDEPISHAVLKRSRVLVVDVGIYSYTMKHLMIHKYEYTRTDIKTIKELL